MFWRVICLFVISHIAYIYCYIMWLLFVSCLLLVTISARKNRSAQLYIYSPLFFSSFLSIPLFIPFSFSPLFILSISYLFYFSLYIYPFLLLLLLLANCYLLLFSSTVVVVIFLFRYIVFMIIGVIHTLTILVCIIYIYIY